MCMILTFLRHSTVIASFRYSMCGSVAPIEQMVAVARKHNALTFLDEVHAVGLYGDTGAGVAERDGIMGEIDVISGTLAKAYVVNSSPFVTMIRVALSVGCKICLVRLCIQKYFLPPDLA